MRFRMGGGSGYFLTWLAGLALFAGHQLFQKVLQIPVPLADSYLDNLLCMPLLLPALRLQQRGLSGRQELSALEIGLATTVVAFASEWLFPRLSPAFTPDLWDVAAYFGGALVYYYFSRS